MKAKMTHTKGPWEREGCVVRGNGLNICTTNPQAYPIENETEQSANTDLITAAPDLLEICRSIGIDQVSHIVWRKIEKAIAKVEGKSL